MKYTVQCVKKYEGLTKRPECQNENGSNYINASIGFVEGQRNQQLIVDDANQLFENLDLAIFECLLKSAHHEVIRNLLAYVILSPKD